MFLFHQCCVRRAVYFCCFAVIFWWKTGQDSGLHTVFLQEWRSFKVLLQPKNSTWVKITYICKILFPCLCECSFKAGLGIRSFDFWANRSFFAQKWANEQFAQRNDWFTHSLIFGERPEWFTHNRSFPLSDVSEMSNSLTSLRGNERSWANRSHRSPRKRKWAKMSDSLIFQ